MGEQHDAPAPSPEKPYRHQQLDFPKHEFRLIELLPTTASNESSATIQCKISHHSLKHERSVLPEYTAISWTWGHEPSIHFILLSGSRFPVRQSLHDCLHAMRETGSYFDTFLWADQLCIDQSDVDERNSQVQLMHTIYTRAKRVCAWLGPSTSHSVEGLGFLSDFQSWCVTTKADQPTLEFLDTEEWQPLLITWLGSRREPETIIDQIFDILERPYWTRIWIVQELLCAQSVELLCGTSRCRIDHEDLPNMRYFHQLYRCVDSSTEHMYNTNADAHFERMLVARLATTLLSYKGLEHEPWFTLSNALQLSLDRKCEDPRDRVYGLQAIVEPTHRVVIDYTLSKEEVYRNARWAMESYKMNDTTHKVIRSLREEMGLTEDS